MTDHIDIYTNLVVINQDKEFEIAETIKLNIENNKRITDLLQLVHNHLEKRNDGNKIYKMHAISTHMTGDAIKNVGSYVQSYFENGGDAYVHVMVSIDQSKHVAPLKVIKKAEAPVSQANKPVPQAVATVGGDHKTLTKYSYAESGEKYVKVLLDFPDAKNLIQKDNVTCTFGDRTFEILVNNYKGENYRFAVQNLHHRILTKDCSWSLKSNNVQVTLRKRKNEDNWWSLHKQKAVGEKAGDSD